MVTVQIASSSSFQEIKPVNGRTTISLYSLLKPEAYQNI